MVSTFDSLSCVFHVHFMFTSLSPVNQYVARGHLYIRALPLAGSVFLSGTLFPALPLYAKNFRFDPHNYSANNNDMSNSQWRVVPLMDPRSLIKYVY